ncbi:MAG TPA: N-acetylmannosamine-6-phosphate 2-epimerase [Pseudoflavonifractor sp.]|nr:N-acetylmannosamine-6-phosphate 2-epimerase [Pseudoflavonifractor sp.]
MNQTVKKLLGGLVISCQAYENTPLYGPDNMKRMAECAIMGGADGLRACWPQDIRAIRSVTGLPIIGINKKFGGDDPLDEIFITPTLESAAEVIEAGADVVAIDCTIRPRRGFDALCELLSRVKGRFPEIPIMADLATLEEAKLVAGTGLVDIISSTLSGYTRQSLGRLTEGPDLEIIRQLAGAVPVPVNGEGRIWELAELRSVIEAGADMVTIGTAVTRPHLIAGRFTRFNRIYRETRSGPARFAKEGELQ